MPLFLALSCLQGRGQTAAFRELVDLGPDGIQLTPGNLPDGDFLDVVADAGVPVRFHHGFAWGARGRPVYDRALRPVAVGERHSVHPPTAAEVAAAGVRFADWIERAAAEGLVVETMFPGEWLGTGDELMRALDAGVPLAVDVSHLHIQRVQGVLAPAQLDRLLDHPRIEEIHVSANDGRLDRHQALRWDSYLVDWARERMGGTPVVLESYMHRASDGERRRQLAVLSGGGRAVLD